MTDIQIYKPQEIQNLILSVRNEQVMLDRDLASLYAVTTKVLHQAVKRNVNRFPETFRFQLSDTEKNEPVTNCDRFETLKYYSFIKQHKYMLVKAEYVPA